MKLLETTFKNTKTDVSADDLSLSQQHSSWSMILRENKPLGQKVSYSTMIQAGLHRRKLRQSSVQLLTTSGQTPDEMITWISLLGSG